jgi:hypothetical protein
MTRTCFQARALAAVLAVCAAGATLPARAAKMHNAAIAPVSGSQVTGTASISPDGPHSIVFVSLTHGATSPQSAGIVKGPCPGTDRPVVWGLSNLIAGNSQTNVSADLHTVLNGTFVVVVRASTMKDAPIVACGVLPLLPKKAGR